MKDEKGENERQGIEFRIPHSAFRIPHSAFRIPKFNPKSAIQISHPYSCLSASIGFILAAMIAG